MKKIITLFAIVFTLSLAAFGISILPTKAFADSELSMPTAQDNVVEVQSGFEVVDDVSLRLQGNAMKFTARVNKDFHDEISDGADEVTYFATINIVGNENVMALSYGVQPTFESSNEYQLNAFLNFDGASQAVLDIALKTEFESASYAKVVKGGETTYYKATNSNEVERQMRVVALDAYLNFEEGKGYEKSDILDLGYFAITSDSEMAVQGEQGRDKVTFSMVQSQEELFYIENGKIQKLAYDQEKGEYSFNFKQILNEYKFLSISQDSEVRIIKVELKQATEGLQFILINNDTEYEVTGYTGTATVVYIPCYYNDKPVVSIGDKAFYNCSSLTSVTMGNSVESIGDRAFSYCASLTSIEIPESITNIGESAFYHCNSLETIEIPDSVTNISSCAFCGCSNLTSVTFGESSQLESIGSSAFYGCSNLTSIEIPSSVTSIGEWAFYNCTSLTSIEIPDSVTSISSYAFGDCTSLTSVTFGENSQLENIGAAAFCDCNSLVSITLPFVGASKTANNGYDQVFGYIFGYESTSSFINGATYQYSNGYEKYYYYIPSLKSVTIFGGEISNYAFYNCSSLTSVTIGESVTNICPYAFYGCLRIEQINFNATNCMGLDHDDNYAFYNAGQLGEGITVIFGDNVEHIPSYLFQPLRTGTNVPKITSVTIGNSVTSIGFNAFYNCSSLTSVTIGESVTNIYPYAFYNCTAIEQINFNATNCTNLPSNDNYVFYNAGQFGEGITVIFGDNVERIPAYLFYPHSTSDYVPKITSVKIGNSVTSIGHLAFYNCSGLTNIEIPDRVTSIGAQAFYNCDNLTSVTFGENSQLESIGFYAFSFCDSLETIEIPSSVTSIGFGAFNNCDNLTTIYCEAESQPSGWDSDWNAGCSAEVVWGYTGE